MLNYRLHQDPSTHQEWIETSLTGKNLLLSSLLNKGTAFTLTERLELDLLGKLPLKVETLEDQLKRAYHQFQSYKTDLKRYVYLNNLRDKNETLFYRLVLDHLSEMVPIIYTPVVGEAVKFFNREFRQPRGLYIPYPHQEHLATILKNRTHPAISVCVVTDGERVLGLGDQGIGAIQIPIAKLALYTIGGINPYHTLPIVLDVGTNNETLLKDPFYLGWKHPRVTGQAYDDFIEQFVCEFYKQMPKAFLHWEDFGRENARRILERYQDERCTFNGDLQGTSVVALAALMTAMRRLESRLSAQRFVIFGAGTAGVGIADRIVQGLMHEGLTKDEAYSKIWLVDKEGLLTENSASIQSFQRCYLKKSPACTNLSTIIEKVQATVLIGCSTKGGAFSKDVVQKMLANTPRPIIFPLSNPSEQSEATPQDLRNWTNNRALIATGSPFQDPVAQCNNFFAFPGLGLGVIASKATCLTDTMLWRAANTLSCLAPTADSAPLLPDLDDLIHVTYEIAKAIVEQARLEAVANIPTSTSNESAIDSTVWKPYYRPIKLSL